jgi:hypothetical protein
MFNREAADPKNKPVEKVREIRDEIERRVRGFIQSIDQID